MNVMLASGGYPWTVIRVEDRDEYLSALDSASVDENIKPFVHFIEQSMHRALEPRRVELSFSTSEERYIFGRDVVVFWGQDGTLRIGALSAERRWTIIFTETTGRNSMCSGKIAERLKRSPAANICPGMSNRMEASSYARSIFIVEARRGLVPGLRIYRGHYHHKAEGLLAVDATLTGLGRNRRKGRLYCEPPMRNLFRVWRRFTNFDLNRAVDPEFAPPSRNPSRIRSLIEADPAECNVGALRNILNEDAKAA